MPQVSPRYNHRKLEPPFQRDMIDVFEDQIQGWLIEPAENLLNSPRGIYASLALTVSYFEMIEMYRSGIDSDGRSREFFTVSFLRLFGRETGDTTLLESAAKQLYKKIRCGVAHAFFPQGSVFLSSKLTKPMLFTWAKENKEYAHLKAFESVIINPILWHEAIKLDFVAYIRLLKAPDKSDLQAAFVKTAKRIWELDKPAAFMHPDVSLYFKDD
jgi:hypothetical protein